MNQPAQAMNPLARCFMACTRWQGRTRRALRHSIKLRLVLVFLLLALAMAFTFIGGNYSPPGFDRRQWLRCKPCPT